MAWLSSSAAITKICHSFEVPNTHGSIDNKYSTPNGVGEIRVVTNPIRANRKLKDKMIIDKIIFVILSKNFLFC
jgi:hypothetical protein